MAVWDCIVIGAGIEGSATAYSLSKLGYSTLQLEQFTLPHGRGSSHGHSRIIRKAYTEPHYAQMMPEAYKLWAELERETKSNLILQTGLLIVDKSPSKEISHVQESLTILKSNYELLHGKEISKKFPMLQFDDSYSAILDKDGGILRADKCLQALQNQFIKHGGVIQDNEPVLDIVPKQQQGGDIVNIRTPSGIYTAKCVIITAGPWSSRLLNPLGLHPPLTTTRVDVWYWKQLKDEYSISKGFPTFIYIDEGKEVFGLPELEYPGLAKVAFHGGSKIDPDRRDDESSADGRYLRYTSAFVKRHMPGLETQPSITETCIYTLTPDNDFILDSHPKWKNVIIGAGFSGHGFKLAPIVGKVLAELATGRQPSYCLKPFRVDRFKDNKPKL